MTPQYITTREIIAAGRKAITDGTLGMICFPGEGCAYDYAVIKGGGTEEVEGVRCIIGHTLTDSTLDYIVVQDMNAISVRKLAESAVVTLEHAALASLIQLVHDSSWFFAHGNYTELSARGIEALDWPHVAAWHQRGTERAAASGEGFLTANSLDLMDLLDAIEADLNAKEG